MESSNKAVGKRKVIEHAVLFQLKADTSDKAKQDIVDGLADLKESCAQWVQAESLGYVRDPGQAKGASIGLFVRFFSKEALDEYFDSEQKTTLARQTMSPHMTGEITIDYEAEVDDDHETVHREGEKFKSGVERIVGIKVKEGTSQEDIDTMIRSLNDLNGAPKLSAVLVQITAGANFCVRDNRYTHGLVARCPSVEALEEYSNHPHHIDVLSKTLWPIAEKIITADYVIDCASARRALM